MPRPTLDIDFMGRRIDNDKANILTAFKEIASLSYPEDCITFHTKTLTAEDITVEKKYPEFKSVGFLKLSNGVPSRDTIRRVVEAVNPEQMRASLAICRDNIVSSLKSCHVIINGKKLRGENPTSRGCNGLYILNAMVSSYEICVGL